MIFFLPPNTKGGVRQNVQVLESMFLLLIPYSESELWPGDLKLQNDQNSLDQKLYFKNE